MDWNLGKENFTGEIWRVVSTLRPRVNITPELLPMTLTKQKQTHTSTVVVDIVSHVIEKYVRLLSFFPQKQQQILILLY